MQMFVQTGFSYNLPFSQKLSVMTRCYRSAVMNRSQLWFGLLERSRISDFTSPCIGVCRQTCVLAIRFLPSIRFPACCWVGREELCMRFIVCFHQINELDS